MPALRAGDPPAAGPTAPPPPSERPRRTSLSSWSVSTRLVALFVMASVLGLVFGGLRIADAVSTANAYSRSAQLADVGQQLTQLAQDMENERDITAGVMALNLLSGNATTDAAGPGVVAPLSSDLSSEQSDLAGAELATDAAADRAETLVEGIGSAYPAEVQSEAATVLKQITYLLQSGGLRPTPDELKSEISSGSADQLIESYSGVLQILFALESQITTGSGDVQLGDDVRALTALSAAEDQASQQRAILYGALIASALNDTDTNGTPGNNVGGPAALADFGGLYAFTTAQDLQFEDTQQFSAVASPVQANEVNAAQATPDSQSAQLIETLVSASGDPTIIFQLAAAQTNMVLGANSAETTPHGWFTDMSSTVNGMRAVNDQLAAQVVARSRQLQHQAFESAVLTAVVTVLVVLLVLAATALVARSLVNPLRRLQADALDIASVRLPARVAAAASGTDLAEADPGGFGEVEPIGVEGTDEIARVARAFDQVHAEAVRLAGTEAQLRSNLNTMFISLSRRSVPLIDRLSRMIDNLEQNETDSEQLSHLFSMDHLVTRMRRNSENLLVLAGEEPVRKWSEPVPLGDVARAASAEIEQYGRVTLTVQPGIMVSGQAAADIVHLLAELIENATLFSPRENQIQVSVGDSPGGGVLVEVRDEGVGVSATRLAEMNWRLDHPPGVDVSVSRHMGLFAVSRLAARHGIRVRLRAGSPQGLTALVWLPGSLTSREQPLTVGMHSRPRPEGNMFNEGSAFGDDPGPSLGAALQAAHGTSGLRQRTTGRPGGGRHRLSLLATSGDQPVVGGGSQPVFGGGSQPVAGGGSQPKSVWFAAKTPSGRAASGASAALSGSGPLSATAGGQTGGGQATGAQRGGGHTGGGQPPVDPASAGQSPAGRGWGSAGVDWSAPVQAQDGMQPFDATGWPTGGPPAGQPSDRQTQAGLPVRVPRTHIPFDGPPSGYDVPRPEESPVLGAPPGAGAQQQTPRLRSPEAARSRLSGFQLGNRDAARPGSAPGRTPYAGEETSR